jgi:Cu(I)/Ag(I) efflux system membrane fusion protein
VNRLTKVSIAFVVFAVGLVAAYHVGQRRAEPAAAVVDASGGERKALYWYDPMVPDQHFDKPGKSPFMDMMLVPRYADEQGTAGIQIDPGIRQNLGVRTAMATVEAVSEQIRVPGTLQWDLRGEHRVSARVEGLVEQVHVRAPYERVKRGDPLATLLAPALASAIAEYRALAASESSGGKGLQAAARSRLALLGLTPGDLRAAGAGVPRIVLRAPADGVLGDIAVRAGDTVMPGQMLFRLNATHSLWLEARVPQAQAGLLRAGAAAEVTVSAFPSTAFAGTVEAVLPEVDTATRTQTVRIVLANPDGTLAAGMFADAVLQSSSDQRWPWIPSEALILTGRDARVIVKQADDSFVPVRVKPGRQIGDRTEILHGLAGGENVVVSGQFLIDSEASLSGALSRLDEADPATTSPTAAEGATSEMTAVDGKAKPERKVLYWYDPMVPDKHFDRPGKSPFMDMPLVPKYADEADDAKEHP